MGEGSNGTSSEQERREKILRYVEEFARENQEDATVPQVATALGLPFPFVERILEPLRVQYHRKPHSRPTALHSSHVSEPLNYGDVGAGPGVDQERVETHESDGSFLDEVGARDDDFTLRVRGDSLQDLGIEDHDWALLRPVESSQRAMNGQIGLHNGQVVLAVVWDSETQTWLRVLKRFYRNGDEIWLKSANSAYPDKCYRPDEIAIQAFLINVIRVFCPTRRGAFG